MPELNTRTLEVREYHRMRPLRLAWFKATAKQMAPDKWLVSMVADYVPSQDNVETGADPLPTMIEMHKAWREAR